MRQILGSYPLPRQAVGSSTSVPRFRRHCPSHKDLPQATSIKDDLRVKFLKKTITLMPYCFPFLCTHTLILHSPVNLVTIFLFWSSLITRPRPLTKMAKSHTGPSFSSKLEFVKLQTHRALEEGQFRKKNFAFESFFLDTN